MRLFSSTFIVVLAATGCSPPIVTVNEAPVPRYQPANVAQAALAEFDKDKNGTIDGAELSACPALKVALAALDTNGDKKVSGDEIRKRVEAYAALPSGTIPVVCTVLWDGTPLAEAVVTFTPEACLSDTLKPATGKTDADGGCFTFQIDGKTYGGLSAGLYRIQVTKEGVAIPARFNTKTTLGREVFTDGRSAEVSIELPLSSR